MCHGQAHSTAVTLKFCEVKEMLFAKHYCIVWLVYVLDLSSASDTPTNKLGENAMLLGYFLCYSNVGVMKYRCVFVLLY
jgi:hypothetical protein